MKDWSGNIDYVRLIRNAWRLAHGHHRRLVLIWSLQVITNALTLVQPIIVGKIVEAVAQGGPMLFHNLVFWLLLMVGSVVAFFALQIPSRYMERRLAFHLRKELTGEMYREVTALPWSWHQNHHSGDTLNRIKLATDATFNFTDWHFLYLDVVLRLVGSVAFLLWVSPLAGLVIGLTVPAMIALLRHFNAALLATNTAQNEAENTTAAGLFDYLGNIATILTLRLQEASHGEIMRRLGLVQGWFHQYIMKNEIKWGLFSVLLEISSAVALLAYVWQHQADPVAVLAGTIATIFQYLRQINICIRNFADRQQDLMKYRVAVDGARGIHDAYHAMAAEPAGAIPALWQTAAIGSLRFRYQDQEHRTHHLDGVSLKLVNGRRIALVGTSGSGKSTLLRLIRGLHKPEAGELLVDGMASRFSALADISTLVPQEPEIFENTLRYNITCGVADEDSLEPVLKIACLDTVIAPLDKGLDTDIREKGVNLSGGQKQRLALARGLFASRDSSLLLLDEPTSSLDPTTEATVFDRIFAAKKDSCIIASIHRLHLLERFDYVYVLEAGQVVEEGTLPDLLATDGKLKAMWDSQKSREDSEAA